MIAIPEVRLRQAEPRDREAVFALSNDPVVRANSIHTEPISWETHVAWFDKVLSDPDVKFFIAETVGGRFVGQVRFNRGVEGWIISVSVVEEFRGKGLSRTIIPMALADADSWPVIAHVKRANAASLHAFASCGFVCNGSSGSDLLCMTLKNKGDNV